MGFSRVVGVVQSHLSFKRVSVWFYCLIMLCTYFNQFEKDPNRMLLWHGSRLSNWTGILSQGLSSLFIFLFLLVRALVQIIYNTNSMSLDWTSESWILVNLLVWIRRDWMGTPIHIVDRWVTMVELQQGKYGSSRDFVFVRYVHNRFAYHLQDCE